MNTRKARKVLPHRLSDVIACLKWKRYLRLHLASNLCTELATVVEGGTRNQTERGLMILLKSAILSKDRLTLIEILGAIE